MNIYNRNQEVKWICLQRRCSRRTAKPSGFLNTYGILDTVGTSRCQVQFVLCLFTSLL